MKKTLSEYLIDGFLRFLFFGHAASFAVWWYISPKGFPLTHPRFWTNSVIPLVIIFASLICWIGTLRSYRFLLPILMPSYPMATLAFIVIGAILYPISMNIFFLGILYIWLSILVILCFLIIKSFPIKTTHWPLVIILAGLAAAMGAMLPWSQQSRESATRPLRQKKIPKSNLALNPSQSAFELSNQVTVLPGYAEVMVNSYDTQLNLSPLLTFYSCSPDRCWILFASRRERIGTKHHFQGMRRVPNGLYLEYESYGTNTFEIKSKGTNKPIEIETLSELINPVYSHLNTFTEFTVRGKEKIFVSFSPCADKRIEVTAFDYPFGRPARLAYLDKSGIFKVVQAKSAEKGPYKTLAEGELKESRPLELTLYDGDNPIYRITFNDWASQCSKQLSPTAGWGLPENAIEFSLDGEKENQATFYVTLASTSTGRGFDSVGHNAGIYQNRIRIESLNN